MIGLKKNQVKKMRVSNNNFFTPYKVSTASSLAFGFSSCVCCEFFFLGES
jgi:hypothetical protein